MIRFLASKFFLVFLLAGLLNAHETWIVFQAGEEGKSIFYLCSGHDFPESETIVSEKLADSISLVKPAGKSEEFQLVESKEKNCWQAEAELKSTGTYLACYSLKRPQMEEPLVWGKTIISYKGDSGNYSSGNGLEIVPLLKLTAVEAGEKLPLVLYYNGERVSGSLRISPAGSGSYHMRTAKEYPAEIKIKKSGWYLITAGYEGKKCSLTFFVEEKE